MSGSGSFSGGQGLTGSDSLTARMEQAMRLNPTIRRGDTVHDFTRTRPDTLKEKCGKTGRAIALKANFVKMQKVCDEDNITQVLIYQYHVSFDPLVDSKRMKQEILRSLPLGVVEPICDGMILYLPRQLRQEKFLARHPNTNEEIMVKMELSAELIPSDPQCTTFLNVTNRRVQERLGLIQINRHFFDRNQSVAIPAHKMEVWPGYNSAIRRYEESLLLNIDVCHKLLRQDTVLDYILQCLGSCGGQGKDVAYKDLVGTSILTKYNNKLYHVDDILWDKHPESTTFDKKDGTTINLCQYMNEQYGLNIAVGDQPLILSRSKKRGLDGNANADVLLIPEVCYMTGLSERMRGDTRVMRDLATRTRMIPQDRVKKAEGLVRAIHNSADVMEILDSWGLELEDELVRVKGRVLPVEPLIFADGRETKFDARKAEWTRECKGKKPLVPKSLDEGTWALIFPTGQCRQLCERLYNTMKQEGQRLGMPVGLPVLKELDGDDEMLYADAMREAVKKDGVGLVVACVPNDFKGRYDAVKKVACLECPVPSQVVLANTLRRDNILCSIVQKILLQICCKMGGAAWGVKVPMKRIMMVGYDSYTDSSAKGKAVGAAVFSLKDDLSQWLSLAKLHNDPKSESTNISTFFAKALRKYEEHNGCLPERVFFYRSGVGEGQIPVVFNIELDLVKSAIDHVYGKGAEERGEVKLAFLIVNKKINTRFFAETPGKAGSFENPPPGTVVDSVVTRIERYDFFLIPQSVNQGSVTPVAYNVIYDRSGLSADQMQRLAFKLSHLYYNWQGTIRVPAPCMFAHKLAFLTSQSTHSPAHDALQEKLYYL